LAVNVTEGLDCERVGHTSRAHHGAHEHIAPQSRPRLALRLNVVRPRRRQHASQTPPVRCGRLVPPRAQHPLTRHAETRTCGEAGRRVVSTCMLAGHARRRQRRSTHPACSIAREAAAAASHRPRRRPSLENHQGRWRRRGRRVGRRRGRFHRTPLARGALSEGAPGVVVDMVSHSAQRGGAAHRSRHRAQGAHLWGGEAPW
jgi:hypothetical protein